MVFGSLKFDELQRTYLAFFFFPPHSSPYINIFCWKIFQWNQWFYSFTVMSRFHLCFGVIKKNDNITTFKFSTKLDACYLKKKKVGIRYVPQNEFKTAVWSPSLAQPNYRACKFLFKNWFHKIWKIFSIFQNEIDISFFYYFIKSKISGNVHVVVFQNSEQFFF